MKAVFAYKNKAVFLNRSLGIHLAYTFFLFGSRLSFKQKNPRFLVGFFIMNKAVY